MCFSLTYIFQFVCWSLLPIWFAIRVRFNDSWFVFHDSSWSFREPCFSWKHIFHELYRANKKNQIIWQCHRFQKRSYGRFSASSISLSNKSFVNITFYGAENNKLKGQGKHSNICLLLTIIYFILILIWF